MYGCQRLSRRLIGGWHDMLTPFVVVLCCVELVLCWCSMMFLPPWYDIWMGHLDEQVRTSSRRPRLGWEGLCFDFWRICRVIILKTGSTGWSTTRTLNVFDHANWIGFIMIHNRHAISGPFNDDRSSSCFFSAIQSSPPKSWTGSRRSMWMWQPEPCGHREDDLRKTAPDIEYIDATAETIPFCEPISESCESCESCESWHLPILSIFISDGNGVAEFWCAQQPGNRQTGLIAKQVVCEVLMR